VTESDSAAWWEKEERAGRRSHGAAVNKRLKSKLLIEPTLACWQVVSGSWHVPDRHDAMTFLIFSRFRISQKTAII